jgi:hypothetical protein
MGAEIIERFKTSGQGNRMVVKKEVSGSVERWDLESELLNF